MTPNHTPKKIETLPTATTAIMMPILAPADKPPLPSDSFVGLLEKPVTLTYSLSFSSKIDVSISFLDWSQVMKIMKSSGNLALQILPSKTILNIFH